MIRRAKFRTIGFQFECLTLSSFGGQFLDLVVRLEILASLVLFDYVFGRRIVDSQLLSSFLDGLIILGNQMNKLLSFALRDHNVLSFSLWLTDFMGSAGFLIIILQGSLG